MKTCTLLLLLLFLISCSSRKDSVGQITVSGRIEGDEIDLAFKVPGRITDIGVREGDRVQAGQVLARMSATQEEIRLKEAEARLSGAIARLEQTRLAIETLEQQLNVTLIQEEQANIDAQPRVNEAQAQLAALKSQLERARIEETMTREDADRYAQLAEKGAVPQQLANQYASRVRAARAGVESVEKQVAAAESVVQISDAGLKNPRIRAAEAQTVQSRIGEMRAAVKVSGTEVTVARAAVEHARADLAELAILAPVDGTVVTRAAEPGRVTAAGQTVLTVVDPSSLYLRGFIPFAQSDLVKLGQPAIVSLPSESLINAEVSRIDPQGMFTPENTYFKEERVKQVVGIKLRLKDNAGKAKIGMPADAIIKTS